MPNHQTYGYECYREVYLLFPIKLFNDSVTFNTNSNTSSVVIDSHKYHKVKIPPEKISGALELSRESNLIEQLSFTVRTDFVNCSFNKKQQSVKEIPDNQSEFDVYYPLMDPVLLQNLRVESYCGYSAFRDNPEYEIYFGGILISMEPQFDADGRSLVSFTFYDSTTDMAMVARHFSYPCLNASTDKLEILFNKTRDKLKAKLDSGQMTVEEFNKEVASLPNNNNRNSPSIIENRKWAERTFDSPEMSLKEIIEGIFTLYKSKFDIGSIPPEFANEKFTIENPIKQDVTDYQFISEVLEKRGYTFYKTSSGGGKDRFIIKNLKQVDNADDPNTFRFVMNRVNTTIYDFNPFVRDNKTTQYNADIREDGSYETGYIKNARNFVIKGGLRLNVSSNGYLAPGMKIVDDKIIMTGTNSQTGAREETVWVLNTELVDAYTGDDPNSEEANDLLYGILSGTYTWDDIKVYFKQVPIDRQSNDPNDTPFKRFIYQGWNTSFTTVGNPFVVISNWYPIINLGVALSFQWQCMSVTHVFTHKWDTSYEFQR
jgi:hypothetical protein